MGSGPRYSHPPGTHTPEASRTAQAEIQSHLDALAAARDEAVQTFTGAAAALAEALRAYGEVWRAAERAAWRHARHNATPTAWYPHPDLDPGASRFTPTRLKEALGRVLSAAGVNVTSQDLREGGQQRRAARQRNRGGQ